ncbi:MAG: hypothetical protein Ta2B_27010 [Termitinemataceae bacterium]|nr:MAG: hypothetical protein Ta2B_27010 [Termitinemataceae bacterium]
MLYLKKCFYTSTFFIFSSFLLFSCGDLDVLGNGSEYAVNGLVDGVSLDECAVISSSSLIEPYFDCNIAGDADTQALRVLIKDFGGKVVAVPLRYELSEEAKNKKVNKKDEGDDSPEETNDKDLDSKKSDENANLGSKTSGSGTETGKAEDSVPATDKTQDSKEKKEAEDGQETEKKPVSVIEELVIKVDRFDRNLPVFSLPEESESGFYFISFQIIGKSGELLHITEKPIYYLASLPLAIETIQSYLPGVSKTPHVIPPSSPVMLEAKIKSDESISPYIVWYCGKDRIAEGPVKNGVFRFIWQSPEENGFQPIKAEIFPFDPLTEGQGVHGVSREMSLPVSEKHGHHGYFDNQADGLASWYEFANSLNDSKDPENEKAYLVSGSNKTPLWLPYSVTYGLAVGSDDVWTFPTEPFSQLKKTGGNMLLQMRFAPLQNGSLLETEFFDSDTGFVYNFHLDIFDFVLILTCEKQGVVYRAEAPIIKDNDGFVVAALNFNFDEDYITIDIGSETRGKLKNWKSISINGTADGNGNVHFGRNSFLQIADPLKTAIISEIALSYTQQTPVSVEDEGDAENNEIEENEDSDEQTVTLISDTSVSTDEDSASVPILLRKKTSIIN